MTKSLKAALAASPLSRRTLFAGAGTVGALAAAAAVLPKVVAPVPTLLPAAVTAADSGYQLTEHVQRYYQTARV